MKKIPSLFVRNFNELRLITKQVTPGCEWVIMGEGKATVKFDGSACLFKNGKWFKRYDAKNGKTPPSDFQAAQAPDPVTGHFPGWVPVKPEDKWHHEAINLGKATTGIRSANQTVPFKDGQTYELIGPKVQGNPEDSWLHVLVEHGAIEIKLPDTSYRTIKAFLETANIEGIVWHHPDGRMAKIKTRDFGLERK